VFYIISASIPSSGVNVSRESPKTCLFIILRPSGGLSFPINPHFMWDIRGQSEYVRTKFKIEFKNTNTSELWFRFSFSNRKGANCCIWLPSMCNYLCFLHRISEFHTLFVYQTRDWTYDRPPHSTWDEHMHANTTKSYKMYPASSYDFLKSSVKKDCFLS
jgi:hypothetical protein